MEDYDIKTFRTTGGHVLAAWALCAMLFAGLVLGSLINGRSKGDEQDVAVAANCVDGLVRANVPARKGISSCERRRPQAAEEGPQEQGWFLSPRTRRHHHGRIMQGGQ